MDWAHIHIALNHFPIILAVMGAAAAVLATLRPRRGAWMYSAASLTLAGVTVVPTYFTGEPAAKFLARPWYIARGSIHDHESSALISTILIGVAALIAAVAWRRMVRYPRETSLPGALRSALLVGSIVASAHIFYTSLLGGRIIHDSEILRGPRPAGIPEPAGGRSGSPASDSTGAAPRAMP
jgi:NO-binding membrane sensor protein with MHYT domain